MLHDNDGGDDVWDPPVTAEVSFEIQGGYVPPEPAIEPVELNQMVLSMQPATEVGGLLLGTPAGIYLTEGTAGVTPSFFGPRVTALARDPFSVNTYYASGQWPESGTELWGLATSVNGGQSWSETSLQNEAMFEDLAVGTDQAGGIAGFWAGQIHVSMDSGATWDTAPISVWADDLVFASTNPVVVLVAGPDGIQSLNWDTGELTSLVTCPVTAIDRVGQQIAYATTEGVIHLCDDTLTECTTWSPPSSDTVIQMVSEMADPNVMYLLTVVSQIFRSVNGGETWELLVDGGP